MPSSYQKFLYLPADDEPRTASLCFDNPTTTLVSNGNELASVVSDFRTGSASTITGINQLQTGWTTTDQHWVKNSQVIIHYGATSISQYRALLTPHIVSARGFDLPLPDIFTCRLTYSAETIIFETSTTNVVQTFPDNFYFRFIVPETDRYNLKWYGTMGDGHAVSPSTLYATFYIFPPAFNPYL